MTFEGYAGTSSSGFRREIDEERRLSRLRDIIDLYEEHKGGRSPGGPRGLQLGREFDEVRAQVGDFPGVIADDARRTKLLKHLTLTLHPGYLNDCFYYAPHALCARQDKEQSGPVWERCNPERCPNSCVTNRHLPALDEARADAVAMRRTTALSKLQLKTIDNQIDRYDRLIAMARPLVVGSS